MKTPDPNPKDTYWNEDWLREKYHEEELTMDAIAESIDVSRSTIQLWIDKHDLQKESGQSDTLSPKKRSEVHDRDGYECLKCGATNSLEVHHIRPKIRGGSDEKENLATLCKECHVDAIIAGAHKQVTAYPSGEFEAWLNDDLDICGARTIDDGRCQNPAGSCPHHG